MELDIRHLKTIRQQLGLTQKALAKLCGVSQSYITKVEAGLLDPSYSNAKTILDALRSIMQKQEMTAQEIMTKKIISISKHQSIQEATLLMRKHGISQLPVMHEHHVVGYINERALLEHMMQKTPGKVKDIMLSPPPSVPVDAPLSMIRDILRYWPLAMVIKDQTYVGVITKADVLSTVIR